MPGRTWKQWQSRLAFSTNAFKKTTVFDAIDSIANVGYAGCELMADQPHFTPSEMSSGDVLNLADRVNDRSMRVSNVNAFTGFFAADGGSGGGGGAGGGGGPTGDTYHPTWLEDDIERRRQRIEHTLSCIRVGAAMGASTVSLQPGGPMIGTGLSRDEAGRLFAQGIRRCLSTARELGVTLAIEPEPGLFLQTTGEYREWKSEYFADESLVSMNFDIGHAFCVGEDPAIVAREMAGEYAHVHLEDIASSRVHQHLVPGEGAIDFAAIFRAFDDAGYTGWVTVELYPFMTDAADVAERAFVYLRDLLS